MLHESLRIGSAHDLLRRVAFPSSSSVSPSDGAAQACGGGGAPLPVVEFEPVLCVLELLSELCRVARIGASRFKAKRTWAKVPAPLGAPVHDGHLELGALGRWDVAFLATCW